MIGLGEEGVQEFTSALRTTSISNNRYFSRLAAVLETGGEHLLEEHDECFDTWTEDKVLGEFHTTALRFVSTPTNLLTNLWGAILR